MRIQTALLALFFISLSLTRLYSSEPPQEHEQFWRRAHRVIHDSSSVSARARSMGGAYAGLSNGAAGIYENPASLGAQVGHEVVSEMAFDSLKDKGEKLRSTTITVGGAININAVEPNYWPRQGVGNHTVGAAYQYKDLDFSLNDDLEGDIKGFLLAYGRSFHGGKLFGGMGFSYNECDIQDGERSFEHNWRRFEFRWGAIYRVNKRLALGGQFNIGLGKFDNDGGYTGNDGDAYYYELRGGAAYQVSDRLMVVGDLSRKSLGIEDDAAKSEMGHDIWRISNGIEYAAIPKALTLRTGWYYEYDYFDVSSNSNYQDADDGWAGWTGGLSIFHKGWSFGYGLDVTTTGDTGHNLKLEYDW